MQRFVYLYTGTSRLIQVSGINSKFLLEKSNSIFNISQRCLSSKNQDPNIHADLYKPSTAKEKTHVPDALKGHHQSPETFATTTLNDGAKVWSPKNPDGVHVAPLAETKSAQFVSKSTEGAKAAHEATVYSTKGGLNIADPFKTRTLKPDASPGKSAEAAAASAFEPFAPSTSKASSPTAEGTFAPKISSTDVYSTTSSPTAHFDTATSKSSQQETVKYEKAQKSKVFGGQDTSADSKKRPKGNPFNLNEQIKPKQAK
jgi:hypothetical protein